MRRFRPYPVAALAGWTLFVWTNRLWLAWTDSELSAGEKLISTLPLVVFVGLAGATLVLLTRSTPGRDSRLAALVTGFAGFTTLYWAIRLPLILSHDQSVPFKVVHSVLALVSVALAVAAWRAMRGVQAERQMDAAAAPSAARSISG